MVKRVGFLLVATLLVAEATPIVRERGAIYLSDFNLPPMKLALRGPAPCYFELDAKRYAGTLRFPQTVELDAVAPNGLLRVRGNARQGGVAAWIEPSLAQSLPPGFMAKLQKAEERRREVDALIARNEVAIGMTLDEVTRSLGKPQKRSSRVSRDGSTQVFEYIRYKLIPQTVYSPAYVESITGVRPDPRARLETVVVRGGYGYNASTVYVKVPVGTTHVSFAEGIVESIEESEGTLVGANASIVVPPINLVW
jgi:hypothetical protein